MKEYSSTQMGRFCSQWLLKIRAVTIRITCRTPVPFCIVWYQAFLTTLMYGSGVWCPITGSVSFDANKLELKM